MSAGTLFSAGFSVLQVFIIPRIVSVEDFGYWRLFLLYAGYAGLLHMGFADGGLLRWAGRPFSEFQGEVAHAVRFLLVQHLIIVSAGSMIAMVVFQHNSRTRTVVIAVLGFAVIANLVTLLQFALQASRRFKELTISTMAPIGLFVGLAVLWKVKSKPNFHVLIGAYFAAWLLVLLFLWIRVHPLKHGMATSNWRLPISFLALGWPVVLANTAFGLVQTSDRLVLSSAVSIQEFAQYSLAASTLMVPITVIQAIAKVVFPHLAATEQKRHRHIYKRASRLVILAWSLLIPYYIFVEEFVRQYIPQYVSSLPIAKVLLFGVVFFASIQILQVNIFNLYGRQKQFFVCSLIFVVTSIALAAVGALYFRSLIVVAAMQVLAGAVWYQFNALLLRDITGQTWRDFLFGLVVIVSSVVSMCAGLALFTNPLLQLISYYVLMAAPLLLTCSDELISITHWFRTIRQRSTLSLANTDSLRS